MPVDLLQGDNQILAHVRISIWVTCKEHLLQFWQLGKVSPPDESGDKFSLEFDVCRGGELGQRSVDERVDIRSLFFAEKKEHWVVVTLTFLVGIGEETTGQAL